MYDLHISKCLETWTHSSTAQRDSFEAKLGETHPDTAGKPSGNQGFSTVSPLKMTKNVEQNKYPLVN